MARPTIHTIGNYVAGGLSRAQALTLFPERSEVDTIVTDALAADSTVTDAAAAAADNAIAAADLITSEEGTTNLFANRTFDAGISGWTRAGSLETVTHDATGGIDGSGAAKAVTTGSGNQGLASAVLTVAVVPGDVVTFSVYAKASATTTDGRLWIRERNSSHTVQVDYQSVVTVTTDWQRFEITATITDPDTTQVTVQFTTQQARTLWYDNAQIEKKAYATSWVDGTRAGAVAPAGLDITAPDATMWRLGLDDDGYLGVARKDSTVAYRLGRQTAPPTITHGITFASATIASAQTISIMDSRIYRSSGYGNGTTVSGAYTYYRVLSDTLGGAVNTEPSIIEFMTDAPAIEFNLFGVSQYNIQVDGAWVSESLIDPGKINGDRYFTKLTFPDSRNRRIALIGLTVLADIRIGPTYNVWRPDTDRGLKLAMMTDSYGQQSNGYTRGGFATWAGLLLDSRDIRMSASGGTGYLNKGSGSSYETARERYTPDIVPYSPDVVAVFLGINDQGRQTKAVLQTEIETFVDTHDAALPGTPLILAGPWSPNSTTNAQASYIDVRDAIKAAIQTSAGPWGFMDTLTGDILTSTGLSIAGAQPWVWGTGKDGSPAGNGNADRVIGSDGTHPTVAGSQYLGSRVAAAMRIILDDLT